MYSICFYFILLWACLVFIFIVIFTFVLKILYITLYFMCFYYMILTDNNCSVATLTFILPDLRN